MFGAGPTRQRVRQTPRTVFGAPCTTADTPEGDVAPLVRHDRRTRRQAGRTTARSAE